MYGTHTNHSGMHVIVCFTTTMYDLLNEEHSLDCEIDLLMLHAANFINYHNILSPLMVLLLTVPTVTIYIA